MDDDAIVFASIVRERSAGEEKFRRVTSVGMENQNLFSRAREASDEDLFASVERLTLTEHGVVMKVLVLLGEIDRRGIYRERAWPSLFEYCVAHLHYSEGQACRRISAARALQKFPALFDLFEKRAITLTNLAKVSRALTETNHLDLAKAVGTKRKDEAERILASWFPQPDVKPLIRELPTSPKMIPPPERSSAPPALQPAASFPPSPAAAPTTTTGKINPLSEKRYGVHFTIDEKTFQQLEHAKHLTKHRGEAGNLENLMSRAIALLHAELEKERLGKTSRPQSNPRPMKDATAIATSTKRPGANSAAASRMSPGAAEVKSANNASAGRRPAAAVAIRTTPSTSSVVVSKRHTSRMLPAPRR